MSRWVNPVGFVVAGLCLLLPFVKGAPRDDTYVAGGFGWTGVQIVVGGRMHEDVRVIQPQEDGTVKEEPVTVKALYGEDFDRDVRDLPVHPAAAVAVVCLLLGALMPGRKWPAVVAVAAAAGAGVAMWLAQTQVMRHVEVAWDGEAARSKTPALLWPFEVLSENAYGFWVFAGVLVALIAFNGARAAFGEARTSLAAREAAASDHNGPA